MPNRKAITTGQAVLVIAVIAIVAAGGSYAFITSTPPRTVVETQVLTQVQTRVQTVTQVQKLEPVTLLLGWLPGPRFAHYYVAKGMEFYAAEGLDVTIIRGQGALFATQQVEAKQVMFGDGNALSIYLNNAKGGHLRTVLQYQDVDAAAIATWSDMNVKTPKDLEGLRFVSAAGSSIIPMLQAVMPIYGASFDNVKFTPVDAAAQRTLFLRGEADFIPSFWENDKPILEREAAKMGRKVTHFLMADWGLVTYGTGVFVHTDTLKDKRDVVERFVRATIKGIEAMKKDPVRAADLVLMFEPGLDKEMLVEGIKNRERLDSTDFKVTDGQIKATMEFIEKWFKPAKTLTPEELWDFSLVMKR